MEKVQENNEGHGMGYANDNEMHYGSVQDVPGYQQSVSQNLANQSDTNLDDFDIENDEDCVKLKKEFMRAMEGHK